MDDGTPWWQETLILCVVAAVSICLCIAACAVKKLGKGKSTFAQRQRSR
jgi:hypothetical protein